MYTTSRDFSFTELKDNVAEVLGLSVISIEDLEHEVYGPKISKTYRKLSIDESQTDGYFKFLLNSIQSSFRYFESYLTVFSPLDENDIQLILKQYNSKFVTCEISSGVYTSKDLSEVLSRGFKSNFGIRGKMRPNDIHDGSHSITIKNDINMRTKLTIRADKLSIRFDQKSVFRTISGFSPYWDY